MIVGVPWTQVGGGMRVRLSTGRIVHVLDRIPGLPHIAVLRNGAGQTRPATVDPAALAEVVFDELSAAEAMLRAAFPRLEFLMEVH